MAMDSYSRSESSPSHLPLHLCALAVFQNLLNEELIKSVHLYQLQDGTISAIQREFMFFPSSYKQIGLENIPPVHVCGKENVQEFMANLQEGEERGLWICILHYNCNLRPINFTIPNILNLARNPALKTIPELAIDLDRVARFKQALDSSHPQKYLGEKMLNYELTDMQSNFLGIEGFWLAIPGLTTVQDCIDDTLSRPSVIESPLSLDQIDNSYSIRNICNKDSPNPNPGQQITLYLKGCSSCNPNEVRSITGNNSRCLEKDNHTADQKSSPSIVDMAVIQSIEHSHAPQNLKNDASEDPSMLCSKKTNEELPSGAGVKGKKRRASSEEKDENRQIHRSPTQRVANIALKDLAKYFDVPITEASRSLKVGLTVLKRKCREFGIPRWPHRKIKSLDSLIQDLQEEAKRQEREDKAAAMAAMKRTRILETERQKIEKKPGIDIKKDTKRFRQDIFKRRHKARAIKKKHEFSNSNSENGDRSEEVPPVSTILSLMIDKTRTSPSTN